MQRSVPLVFAVYALAILAPAQDYRSEWPDGFARPWIGPEIWANRLEDWRLEDGWATCSRTGENLPMRTLGLLTHRIGNEPRPFRMEVLARPVDAEAFRGDQAWMGFRIGAGGEKVDHCISAMVHHQPAEDGGILAGFDATGTAWFRDFSATGDAGLWGMRGKLSLAAVPILQRGWVVSSPDYDPEAAVRIVLSGQPRGAVWDLDLSVLDAADGRLLAAAQARGIAAHLVDGGVGLMSHRGEGPLRGGDRFRDWRMTGPGVVADSGRAFGPVWNTLHTLQPGLLKLSAQFPPLGGAEVAATLEVHRPGEARGWRRVATARVNPGSSVALFRIEGWDAAQDYDYRVVCELPTILGSRRYEFEGRIPRLPDPKEEVVVAALTCHKVFTGGLRWNEQAIWYPSRDLVSRVAAHEPDLLYFSGDQIYEGDLTGVERGPELDFLSYLDHYARWCMSFAPLTRRLPSVVIPDDHDVFHGNLWGAGGRHAKSQDDGGYRMRPEFVRWVEETQTAHLPDPIDPKPVEQGIGVYFTEWNFAGLSMAILEDRKFKDSPTVAVPAGRFVNGWPQAEDFDAVRDGDSVDAHLLGARQEAFLERWGSDQPAGTWFKLLLSQSPFCNLATLPSAARSDAIVPSLEFLAPGDYAPDDQLATDGDSNGWPRSGRDRAVSRLRAPMLHVCGDQHLASLTRYGLHDHDDSIFAFCTPAIANTWPRRWYPPLVGEGAATGAPRYTGRFRDGFGNRITVHAVANPVKSGVQPEALYDRSPGYGILRFRWRQAEVEVECWPRWVDPRADDARQYAGWPKTLRVEDMVPSTAV
ncbi:MAG: alkaline phosphatase D family protein, partial [Planctomycetes bacterium]|nr:alkaline phosphatase D family protein [Planctomycetota bacterium]